LKAKNKRAAVYNAVQIFSLTLFMPYFEIHTPLSNRN